ncbi:MAG: alpha-hydroxy-acid oxidizing protein, partial [Lachnospiraceae bacterium]|nr:alpha-hydroxy-acid oxidizing protein [Lachnospiraceae bacterium]
ATAVSAGRVIMQPLGRSGAQGVKEQVEQMNEELKGVMARTGSRDLRHIDPSVIWHK